MGHPVVSESVGTGVWLFPGSVLALPAAVAAGVLVDSDHLIEYADWYLRGRRRYMIVFFHAWEYVLAAGFVLAMIWFHPIFLGALLGHAGHLITDQLANRPHPFAYSIVYRISQRFNFERLSGTNNGPTTMRNQHVPIWGRIEPWLWRLLNNSKRT